MQRPFPVLVLEFEPLMANELRSGTAWNLGISVATAVLLMSLALLLLRWIIHREALERRLEHSRRLADLGEMSAVLAHEIRNPLAALKGHAQLLVETLPAASRELAKAHRVVGEAERLESLTSDLLELVRSGNIERAPCDPTLLLQECASSLAEDRFEIHADHAPPSWSLDARRMGQVLTNLLQNALQASPVDRRVKVFVTVEERSLLYVVRDHGEGIPPGENERLFEPFHTTRTRGTGLGLAVARRMVALHGGSITASSHPKGGACFRVTIPKEQTQNGSNPGGR
jgi:two-component system, NtrC family, sensor histidine kinase HydH